VCEFDLIIIGAGPGGAAAAKRAVDLGLRVAIIDKARFPRNKLCGGLISGRSRTAIVRIFGQSPPEAGFLVGRDVQFAWQDQILARFTAPSPLHFTMRLSFDDWLLQRAVAAGTRLFEGVRAKIDPDNNVVTIDGQALRYRVLIGADGVNSMVARHLFGRAFNPATIGFGLECEVPRQTRHGDTMEIDFRAVQWGYGWVFPKPESLTIGIGGLQARNSDMKAAMAAYLAKHGVASEAVQIKGHFIPFGDFRKKPGRRNILLVGDAGGFVDPLTGEGIAYALETGALAAETAAHALDRPTRAATAYFKAIAPLQKELTRVNRLRQIAFRPAFEPRFRTKLAQSDALRTAFFQLLDGELTYRGLERRFASKALSLGTLRTVFSPKG